MKLKKLLSLIVLIIATLSLTTNVEAATTKWKNYQEYKVTASELNIREKPSTSANKVGKLLKGEKIKASDPVNGWSRIYGTKEQYVSSEYLKLISSSTSSNTYKNYATYVVTIEGLSIRNKPSTSSGDILGGLSKGEKIKASAPVNGWSRIYGTEERYVSAKYLTSSSSSSSSSSSNSSTSSSKYKNYATYIVTIEGLSIRNKPSTSTGDILGGLSKGEKIKASAPVNGWSRIYGTEERYVSAKYLTSSSSSSSSSSSNSSTSSSKYKNYATYIVTIEGLSIRNKPSTSTGNILGGFSKGDKIKASDPDENGWRKIYGKDQYVSAKYTVKQTGISLIKVYRSKNVVYCFNSEGKQMYEFKCTVGMKGHETPKGTFYIEGREKNHWSNSYSAWMPFTSWIDGTNGCAFHVGSLESQSHGCVHLSENAAKIIYNQAKDGTKVIIY